MTPNEIIDDVKEKAAEWLEMTENPDAIVSWMLAYKITQLEGHIEYLERRLHHAHTR